MARGFNYAPGASAEVIEATQPGLHKTHIMALGSSRNALVRAAVAARPDCPLGLMVTLAHDYSAEVRCAVARNSSAQRTVMVYLSSDRSVDVLKALLQNPALPPDVVEELAFHKKSDVRSAAAARLDAGEPISVAAEEEDVHNPELAEHVVPIWQAVTADGALPPANVVDITTGAPVDTPSVPPTTYPVVPEVASAAPAVAQIFSPHSTPEAPAPTRTAPIRGFKFTP